MKHGRSGWVVSLTRVLFVYWGSGKAMVRRRALSVAMMCGLVVTCGGGGWGGHVKGRDEY